MKLTPPQITPGDWHAEGENVLSSKCEEIATCTPVFIFGEEKANVQAIAALPDLLKALEFYANPETWIQRDGKPSASQLQGNSPALAALTKAGYTIE